MAQFELNAALDRARREPGSRRARILKEATRLFGEKGYDAVGMRDVARAAGTNVATVPFHWQNKETLYAAAARESAHLLAEFLTKTAEEASEPGLNLKRQRDLWVDWIIDVMVEHPELARFHLRGMLDDHLGLRERRLLVQTMRGVERYVEEIAARFGMLETDAQFELLGMLYQALGFFNDSSLQQDLLGGSVLTEPKVRERMRNYLRRFIERMWGIQ